ncbi:MAG: hypothetical protein RR795_01540 [Cetobacterium sp.]|uniref:hypothetical protein n=1 Tax=Cetobacterium sp. TaxID=2071632 RepID=UPI002FC7D23B
MKFEKFKNKEWLEYVTNMIGFKNKVKNYQVKYKLNRDESLKFMKVRVKFEKHTVKIIVKK